MGQTNPSRETSAPPQQSHTISTPLRILILKPSSLGDIIHALPTVALIRKKFPDAHITWLINDTFASVLNNCPAIDERIEFPRRRFGSLINTPQFLRFLSQMRARRFDLVVDLQGLFRSGVIAWATGAPRRIALSEAREGSRMFYTEIAQHPNVHAVDRCLAAARLLNCDAGPVEFPLGTSDADRLHVDRLLSSLIPHLPQTAAASRQTRLSSLLIAVSPSARWATKLWGDDKFAALLERLPRERVVLTGSAAEAAAVGKVARGCLNLAGQTDLAQLTELYRRCAVLITNDSGPMHLAAAVGTPVVAMFGPTDPVLTGPYGDRHVVLRSGISCSPCQKPTCAHSIQMECMQRISVEQVFAAVQPFLA